MSVSPYGCDMQPAMVPQVKESPKASMTGPAGGTLQLPALPVAILQTFLGETGGGIDGAAMSGAAVAALARPDTGEDMRTVLAEPRARGETVEARAVSGDGEPGAAIAAFGGTAFTNAEMGDGAVAPRGAAATDPPFAMSPTS